MQLTEDNHEDLRALAEKADRCAASLHRQAAEAHSIAAATGLHSMEEEAEDVTVAAAHTHRQQSSRGGKQRGGRRGGSKSGGAASRAANGDPSTPASLAQLSSGLCMKHFLYGAKAHSCTQPCSWQEN